MNKRLDPTELAIGEKPDELTAIVALIRSQVVPAHRLSVIIDHVGSAVSLVQMSETDQLFRLRNGAHYVIGAVTPENLAQARETVREWLDRGLDVRTILDPGYPRNLHDIWDRPPFLFVRGTWQQAVDCRAIAVVGARKAGEEGLKRARRLARELVEAGFTVLSGLAAGIDTSAHTGALEAGGRTAAVMGTGLDHIYPAENRNLAEAILDSGAALLTQFFPHQRPTQWTFPMRNVVMSGLAIATVVVEASDTSGARMQARVALQHGRTVFLLSSLVESHDWARKYVEEGAYGTRAWELRTTEELLDSLGAHPAPDLTLSG